MNDLDNNLYNEPEEINTSDINEPFEETNTKTDIISENITTDYYNDEEKSVREFSEENNKESTLESDTTIMEDADISKPIKKAKKQKKYRYGKSIAVGLTGVVLCGASLGFFLGIGLNTSDKLVNGVTSISNGSFSFADIDDKNTSNVQPVNLVADENSISKTIASVENAVVNISIKAQSVNFFNQVYESEGAGSGIIYKVDGDKVYIITNNHVIESANEVTISVTGKEQISAKLVGKDSTADIAVISVSKKDMENAGIKDVASANFSNSENVEVGESVIAIGNALGRGKTATLGIISASNKEINIDGKTFNFIQTDAAINPGNSGGALINTSGEVIGINTAKLSDSSVEGTGYAIPSNTAKEVADQLITNGSVKKAYLGISGSTITDDFKFLYGIDVSGVYISKVDEGSAAEKAGIQVSDIITAVDGKNISTIDELSNIISAHKPNDKIKISIIRNGVFSTEADVTLADANSNF